MRALFLSFLACLVFAGQFVAAQVIVKTEGIDSLRTLLTNELQSNEPGFSILIKKGTAVMYEAYFGMASIEENIPLSANSTMGIASMSKQFEGMSVLLLVHQGKLSLNDDIHTYLPDLPLQGQKITIRQLLSHTSGIAELTQNPEFMESISTPHTIDQIIDVGLKQPMRHLPGEKYLYCNTGFLIITKLIEQVSGLSYGEFLRRNFLEPLHMYATYSCDYEHDANGIAIRYVSDSSGFIPAEQMHFSNLIGGGGMVSNVTDLGKWADALLTGKGLPPNYKELWLSGVLNNGDSTGYGLGMGVSEHQGIPFYYHPGMGSGMNSINLIVLDAQLSITIIRNISKPKLTSVNVALLVMSLLIDSDS